MSFQSALKRTLAFEGGYVNNLKDPGGETNMGVTLKTARAAGYTGDMKTIPQTVVEEIYRKHYWNACNLNLLDPIDSRLAEYVFDIAVNMGPKVSVTLLQTAITFYDPAIKVDGSLGPKTADAVYVLSSSQRLAVLKILGVLHGQRYLDIVTKKPDQKVFLAGWMKRVLAG